MSHAAAVLEQRTEEKEYSAKVVNEIINHSAFQNASNVLRKHPTAFALPSDIVKAEDIIAKYLDDRLNPEISAHTTKENAENALKAISQSENQKNNGLEALKEARLTIVMCKRLLTRDTIARETAAKKAATRY